jgi:2,4-dienoyl-CoA reductase (NADPH2)
VNLHLSTRVDADFLIKNNFDEVVLATGITPRTPQIEGIKHPKVLSYIDVLLHNQPVGKSVAIIGAGGIGFDVATFLSNPVGGESYLEAWGVDTSYQHRGGLTQAHRPEVPRNIWLLQRSKGKIGERLGKTTGWAHRMTLKNRGVQMWADVQYDKIDDAGLHISTKGQTQILPVDNIIICAGQNPLRELYEPLVQAGITIHLIGGAKEAGELDAKRAIAEGYALTVGY